MQKQALEKKFLKCKEPDTEISSFLVSDESYLKADICILLGCKIRNGLNHCTLQIKKNIWISKPKLENSYVHKHVLNNVDTDS